MFTPIDIDLGTVKAGKEINLEYSYNNQIKLITGLQVSCDGCTEAKNDAASKKILVKFTPKNVPLHLVNEGKNSYNTTKYVTVHYMNAYDTEAFQKLSFTAKIHN